MKTQVIQLDEHDDVISVRDKMSWAKTARLLLVFPRRGRILERPLDLRRLQRHAAGLGCQLAIVSRSAQVRTVARELALPVFDTATRAQRADWPHQATALPSRPRHAPPGLRGELGAARPAEARWRALPAARLGFFTLAVLAVLALLLLFVPSATIRLSPRTQTQSLSLSVSASPAASGIDPVTGRVPAQSTTIQVQGSQTARATGTASVPDQAAGGQVRFSNLTTSVVGVPAGTIVQTTGSSPVQFATSIDAVVVAGLGKTVDVPVQAVEKGSGGNLPAGQLIAIVGDLGTSLSATNLAPTTGGTDRTVTVATASDRAALHTALLARLKQQALAQLPAALADGDVLFPESLAVKQILDETYVPAEGQPGARVTLDLTVEFEAGYARASDLRALAAAVMNADRPVGYQPGSAPITIIVSQPPVTASGATQWQILAARPLLAQIDAQAAAQLVQGSNVSDAGRKLAARLPITGQPVITMSPSWWPWLPWLPFRITTVAQ